MTLRLLSAQDAALALLRDYRSGWTLDQAFYTDPALFELEMSHLIARSWLFVGHTCEIAGSRRLGPRRYRQRIQSSCCMTMTARFEPCSIPAAIEDR